MKCKIIVNIPFEYKKWKNIDINIPDSILDDNSIIVNRCKDYGPATKLLGAIDYLNNKNIMNDIKHIITIDDDIIYNDFLHIEKLIKNSEIYPNCAIAVSNITLNNAPYRCGNGLLYNINGLCDAPGGVGGVLYPIYLFDKNQFYLDSSFINTLPNGIFNDDDAYFGIILSIMNIPIQGVTNGFNLDIQTIQCGGESAVAENVEINRIDNESNIYNFAVLNKLLPNKYRIVNI